MNKIPRSIERHTPCAFPGALVSFEMRIHRAGQIPAVPLLQKKRIAEATALFDALRIYDGIGPDHLSSLLFLYFSHDTRIIISEILRKASCRFIPFPRLPEPVSMPGRNSRL